MDTRESAGEGTPFPIHIDTEGIWYYRGAEMFRKDIMSHFFEALAYDEKENRYYLAMEGRRYYIQVDDTPYVVRSVTVNESGGIIENVAVLLNDDSREPLAADTLRVGPHNVLYCSVKDGRFRARFTRAAYYQLARCFEHRAETDEFFLAVGRQRHLVHRAES